MKILLTTLNAKYVHSNLALKYLERVAEKTSLNIKAIEFTINNNRDYIFDEIIRGHYDLVCFSSYIWNIEDIKELCEVLKQATPNLKILLGGPEVSFGQEDLMRKMPYVDFILRGEGEKTFASFCKVIEDESFDFSKVKGLTYRDGEKVIVNPDEEIMSMDDVPFPYKEPPEKDKVIYYESSRGCPYRCSYCLSSIEKKVRGRNLETTLKELQYFLDLNVRQVKFIDRTFNYDRERADKIWSYLIEHDNGVTNFHFEICADLINDEEIELLGKARKGLFQLEAGIQTTNEEALKAVNRFSNKEHLFYVLKKLRENNNMHLHVDLIAGLPYEDYESFGHSFDDVYSIGADDLQLGFLKVLHGTRVEAETEIHQMVYRNRAPYEIIGNKYISPEELVKLKVVEAVLELYSNKEGFEETLKLMIPALNKGPFKFFTELGEFYYKEGFQHKSHKKEDLYRIMLKFADSLEGEIPGIKEKAKETLKQDLENTMNFDAVKKFYKKGWEINGN